MFKQTKTKEDNQMSKLKKRNDVFIVESNIPVPPISTGPKSSKSMISKDMNSGQSFLVSDTKSAQRVYAAAKKMGVRIITRKVDDGVRIWRK